MTKIYIRKPSNIKGLRVFVLFYDSNTEEEAFESASPEEGVEREKNCSKTLKTKDKKRKYLKTYTYYDIICL